MGTISDSKREDLGTALNKSIEEFRLYVVSFLGEQLGENWHTKVMHDLNPKQQNEWKLRLSEGVDPFYIIDYHYLKSITLNHRVLFKEELKNKAHELPTLFGQVTEIRHLWAHQQPISDAEFDQAFTSLMSIAKILGREKLYEELEALRYKKEGERTEVATNSKQESPAKVKATDGSGMPPWFKVTQPHQDIREGILDESVFAANLGDVALKQGRPIYQDPAMFFEKTYVTQGIKNIAKRVVAGLNQTTDAENRVISLQTGFGGGKTHTLISLYHLAAWGNRANDHPATAQLVEATGPLNFDGANVAVFTNTTNDPAQGRTTEDGIHLRTLWGELAYQLGGKAAYELIRPNDEQLTAPKGTFRKVLEQCQPALILIDELADYCVSASSVAVGSSDLSDQTTSFIQELSETIASVPYCMLVATLPASASEVASSELGGNILDSLISRLGRVGADTKPVNDEEIFDVIRYRLFENIGSEEERERVIAGYMDFYDKLVRNKEISTKAGQAEYRELLRRSYPFHPELIDMFRVRWASNHSFQRTRGVLRLLASIVSDLWKRQGSLTGNNALIHTSDIKLQNLDALTSQLKKLFGSGYEAVIDADIAGTSSNAFHQDQDGGEDFQAYEIMQGSACTILLGSFGPDTANRGVNRSELKLCVLKPGTFNHTYINTALDKLEENAHYLHFQTTGGVKRYWFHTKPNINILIKQVEKEINSKSQQIDSHIIDLLSQSKQSIKTFSNVLVAPQLDIPEQQQLTLILLHPEHYTENGQLPKRTAEHIKQLATQRGNSAREYRNTMLFLIPFEKSLNKLRKEVVTQLALKRVREEYRSQLDVDQMKDINDRHHEQSKNIDKQLIKTYSWVARHQAKTGIDTLPLQEFVPNNQFPDQIDKNLYDHLTKKEWVLNGVNENTLRSAGVYPQEGQPVQVRKLYTTFLQYDDKPMITGEEAVKNSLERYCEQGEFAIASGEPGAFTNYSYKEVPKFFRLEEETFWLVSREDYEKYLQENARKEGATGDPAATPPYAMSQSGNQPHISEPHPTTGESSNGNTASATQARRISKLTIQGEVSVDDYHQIFNSFVNPLANNQVKIEIKITAESTENNQITESSTAYKITKESASQLSLDFHEESE